MSCNHDRLDYVECDDCGVKACRVCEQGWETNLKEGVRRCPGQMKKTEKKKPYRVIIRSANKKTIAKAVANLVKEFEGDSEIRISKIHRG